MEISEAGILTTNSIGKRVTDKMRQLYKLTALNTEV